MMNALNDFTERFRNRRTCENVYLKKLKQNLE